MAHDSSASRGRQGEALAESFLESKGYRLIARNHRCPRGEVDLIAWDGDILCFIEVRARASDTHGDPLETIDRRKVARVALAAQDFLESWRGAWPLMRFDAVGILLSDPPQLRLVQAAFETGNAW